jgi:hypothetical protein
LGFVWVGFLFWGAWVGPLGGLFFFIQK